MNEQVLAIKMIELEKRMVARDMRVHDLEGLVKFINEEHFILNNRFQALKKAYKQETGKDWQP